MSLLKAGHDDRDYSLIFKTDLEILIEPTTL